MRRSEPGRSRTQFFKHAAIEIIFWLARTHPRFADRYTLRRQRAHGCRDGWAETEFVVFSCEDLHERPYSDKAG